MYRFLFATNRKEQCPRLKTKKNEKHTHTYIYAPIVFFNLSLPKWSSTSHTVVSQNWSSRKVSGTRIDHNIDQLSPSIFRLSPPCFLVVSHWLSDVVSYLSPRCPVFVLPFQLFSIVPDVSRCAILILSQLSST